jgi:2-phosphoglycerate kinase
MSLKHFVASIIDSRMSEMAPSRDPEITKNEVLSSRLRHVYWIGGGSGTGKSTIAKRLADQYGLKHCSTDETMGEHGRRTPPEERPFVCAFNQMDMDERWLNRSPQTMFETFHFFRGECFDRIVEDLLEFPSYRRVVVEGFRLLPNLVKPLLDMINQSVWLLPTPEFRLAAFKSRKTLWNIAEKTSNPGRALKNLLVRDGLFTDRLRNEANSAGLPIIEVDSSVTEDALFDQVVRLFGLK